MAPLTTISSPLARRYTSYNCTDYLYTQACAPHRIIIGVIVAFVVFLVIVVTAALCIRARKHKARKTQSQSQYRPPHPQKQVQTRLFEVEAELRAPPPAYAWVDPMRGV